MTKKQLSEIDILIINFVAEQDAVRLDTLLKYIAIKGKNADIRNLRRNINKLETLGFVRKDALLAKSPYIVSSRPEGMRFAKIPTRRGEKPFYPQFSTIHHPVAVARVRLEYEQHQGAVWTCERKLRTEFGEYHLADGMVTFNQQKFLIEVDRTQKESDRFKKIVSINASFPSIDLVHYWTTDHLYPYVNNQIRNIDPQLAKKVQVYLLPKEVNI